MRKECVLIAAGALSVRGSISRPVALESTRRREILPPIPAVSLVDRVAPIYLVAIAIVTGDALGNFHVAIPPWLASTFALVALGAFLSSRRALGLSTTFLAIVLAANVAVANVLEPPRKPHSVATMVEGSRVTIEGRVYRETEHEAYGDRIYVKVDAVRRPGRYDVGVERQCSNRCTRVQCFQAGRRDPTDCADPFPSQLRESRRVRLRGTDGARRHRRHDDGAEKFARFRAVSTDRASFNLPREPD